MTDEEPRAVVPKACDTCRQRKIRCDRSSPCFNCERAGLVCKASVRHGQQKRTRVLISTQYERKIDLIEEKLDQLVRLVNDVHAMSTTHTNRPREQPSPSGPIPTPQMKPTNAPSIIPPDGTNSLRTGQSSLSAQSALAVEFVTEVVNAGSENDGTSGITDLLGKLRQLVNAFNDRRQAPRFPFPLAASGSARIPGNESMPPLQTALSVLQTSQRRRTFTYLFLSHFVASGSPLELCVRVYVSSDYSEAEYIIVNAAMYFLSNETMLDETDGEQGADERHEQMVFISQRNLEQAFSSRSLQLVGSYDMVLALALGAIFAIDICQPSLAWSLVTTASEISTSLGFHTEVGGTDDRSSSPNRSGLLFWVLYFVQKTLSLQLGRSSTIPDCDITVPLPQGHLHDWDVDAMQYCRDMIRLSNLAARTYERLYSPKSLSQPIEVRTERVLELAQEIRHHCDESNRTNEVWLRSTASATAPWLARLIAASDEVQRFSLLTLVYRAMPKQGMTPTTVNEECITCARLAIIRHQEFITDLGLKYSPQLPAYINWTIIITPFVPFVVLFYNVIQTQSTEDLNLLRIFVHSMSLASHSSTTISNHHSLFRLFYDVAAHYTELKIGGNSAMSPQELDRSGLQAEFDSYFCELGMQPGVKFGKGKEVEDRDRDSDADAGAGVSSGDDDIVAASGQKPRDSQLGEWFPFNQQFMEMLGPGALSFDM